MTRSYPVHLGASEHFSQGESYFYWIFEVKDIKDTIKIHIATELQQEKLGETGADTDQQRRQ